jgi:uncharacterized protein (TIGR01777 family)
MVSYGRARLPVVTTDAIYILRVDKMDTPLTSKRVVIAGGSGFLGASLTEHLAATGYAVTILSRRPPPGGQAVRHITWDARTLGDWKNELSGAAALVNLVGRSVDCIKTPDHQDEILRSRVEATLLLGKALRAIKNPPPVWVQMSTAHIVGDPPNVVCDEDSPPGYGLAPVVAKAWENAYHQSVLPCQRQVILRTSFVVGRNRGWGGGALSRLSLLTRLGFGGRVGSGKQGFSWIHENDLNRLFQRAIEDETMHGVYIASSPNPVPQAKFMAELRRALRVPIGLPAFSWMVRLGAPLLLRTDPELALYGRYVISNDSPRTGLSFTIPICPRRSKAFCVEMVASYEEIRWITRS